LHARDFSIVTETWGLGASREQVAMAACRYQMAGKLAAGKRVLEIGCGAGLGIEYLKTRAQRVVGGDLTMELLRQTSTHVPGVDIAQMDAQSLPFREASFDVVLMLEMMYYIPDLDRAFAECRRVLRQGGQLMVCLPNRDRPDFNPSPFSIGYPNVPELMKLFDRHGFEAKVFGGFRVEEARAFDRLRHVAVRLRLIPRSMRMKAFVKRLLYGPLPTLTSIDALQVAYAAVTELATDRPTRSFKNLYATGRLR